ncbi:MAG: peptidylprolyl isomerase [Phycisphaerales bacterium]|nr:MAG: peptidylprolyl isomerase [Phycisphaerales bacterium]
MSCVLRVCACLGVLPLLAGAQCMGPDIGFSMGGARIPLPGSYEAAAVTDTDGDAIADAEDNCPKVANVEQEDSDGDEVGDLCEPLPATMPQVRIRTTEGNFIVELNDELAPITVANFLSYVEDDFYSGTMFHRVDTGLGIIQGGGFTKDGTRKATNDPIVLEADNGLKNLRGTIAMARTSDPNSATSQFYVNTKDNPGFDPENNPPGYAVFGEVVSGMSVVDEIQALPQDTVEILGTERM